MEVLKLEDYYMPGMPGVKRDAELVGRLITRILPELSQVLQDNVRCTRPQSEATLITCLKKLHSMH